MSKDTDKEAFENGTYLSSQSVGGWKLGDFYMSLITFKFRNVSITTLDTIIVFELAIHHLCVSSKKLLPTFSVLYFSLPAFAIKSPPFTDTGKCNTQRGSKMVSGAALKRHRMQLLIT